MHNTRELWNRTSLKRWFRVASEDQDNPMEIVAKLCPEGSKHPWCDRLRAKHPPIVTEAVTNKAWLVCVEYEVVDK